MKYLLALLLVLVPLGAEAALPPQGLYSTCDVQDTYSTCLAAMQQQATGGFTLEVDYNTLIAHKTGATGSIASWLADSATAGIQQIIPIQQSSINTTDALTATSLVDSLTARGSSYATDCGATTNQQVIDCLIAQCDASAGCWGYYIYDEYGCPHTAIGYCQGGMYAQSACNAGVGSCRYQNVDELALYLQAHSTKKVVGTATAAGPPCGGGGFSCAGGQTQINNLTSCNGQSECSGVYAWLMAAQSPYENLDYYPIPENRNGGGQKMSDIAGIMQNFNTSIAATYAAEKPGFVVQAFTAFYYGYGGCGTITLCPYPTQTQIQTMRNYALFGNTLGMILYYSYEDVTCLHNYTGCNATTNWNQLVAAAFSSAPGAPPCCWLLTCRCKPVLGKPKQAG